MFAVSRIVRSEVKMRIILERRKELAYEGKGEGIESLIRESRRRRW